jgi:hypothetical protein
VHHVARGATAVTTLEGRQGESRRSLHRPRRAALDVLKPEDPLPTEARLFAVGANETMKSDRAGGPAIAHAAVRSRTPPCDRARRPAIAHAARRSCTPPCALALIVAKPWLRGRDANGLRACCPLCAPV